MTIRQETPADIKAIHCVHQAAFAREEEAQLVDRLRQNVSVFVPELSLVAIDGDELVGHVLLSRVHVVEDSDTHESLAMAPVAVRPDKQGRGIGSALIKSALYQARHLGFSSVIVLDIPAIIHVLAFYLPGAGTSHRHSMYLQMLLWLLSFIMGRSTSFTAL